MLSLLRQRLLPIFLILAYWALFGTYLLFLVQWSTNRPASSITIFKITVVWTLIAAAWPRITAPVGGWRIHHRRLIQEEDKQIGHLFQQVLQQLPRPRKYRLRIEESAICNALALPPGTVALSKPLIARLSAEELKAVIAHEIGHLESGDGWVTGWMILMVAPSLWYCNFCRTSLKIALFLLRSWVKVPFVGLLLVGFAIWGYKTGSYHFLYAFALFFLYPTVLPSVQRLFTLGFLYSLQQREYVQDAFAQSLGHGPALRSVLLKLIDDKPQAVSQWSLFSQTHPIIYDRIRRLEILES